MATRRTVICASESVGEIVIECGEGLVKLLRRNRVVEILVVGHHGLTHGLHVFAPLCVGEMTAGSLSEERRGEKTEPECKSMRTH